MLNTDFHMDKVSYKQLPLRLYTKVQVSELELSVLYEYRE